MIISCTSCLVFVTNFYSYVSVKEDIVHIPISNEKNSFIRVFQEPTPYSVAISFLNWYKQNKKRITIRLIKGGGSSAYRVDFNAVEKYLAALKKSEFFTSGFLSDLRRYMERCDANFEKYPQTDFIAQGLESDLITKRMDDMDIMDNIDTLQLKQNDITNDNATVKIGPDHSTVEIVFVLKKLSNKWKIETINGPFPVVVPHY